jgi:hypothetical protein
MLHALLVFLHVLSISVWLAAALWVPGDVKRALRLGRPHLDTLAARVRPALGLDAVAGIATVITGALLMWEEGLGHPPLGISAGIVLTLARFGVLAAMRRAWRRLAARIAAGDPLGPQDQAAARIGMLSGIAHALWLATLAAMVFPI